MISVFYAAVRPTTFCFLVSRESRSVRCAFGLDYGVSAEAWCCRLHDFSGAVPCMMDERYWWSFHDFADGMMILFPRLSSLMADVGLLRSSLTRQYGDITFPPSFGGAAGFAFSVFPSPILTEVPLQVFRASFRCAAFFVAY